MKTTKLKLSTLVEIARQVEREKGMQLQRGATMNEMWEYLAEKCGEAHTKAKARAILIAELED
ncbi:MAG: hypothetical protein LBV12_07145 [Puniceicoccales bacterium]|jgi:hypothetical protein|nr:hypothetical protein [Puniceicoccales bacterium]